MAEPPRVLHVLRGDHAGHVGGDLVQLSSTVEGLRSAGVDALAATIEEAPADIGVVHLYNLQRPAALLRDLRRARRRWPEAAVVLSPVWWPMRLRDMARTRDRELVGKAIKTRLKGTAWWPFLRHVLSAVDLVLPNSEAEVRALRRSFRLSPSDEDQRRWAVVPNGIHLERWPLRRASAEERAATIAGLGLDPSVEIVAACVARVEPVKNQLAVVRALDRLPHVGLALIGPVGEERYGAAVRSAADDPRRRGRVAFAGRLPPEAIGAVLASVDVHVLASYRETPGLASLEAAATGCAVVVTADGSAPEYFGSTAYVADPVDETSIATAIAAAAADPRQPAARRQVERHDWSAAVQALLAAYARLPGWLSSSRS